ncbi:DHA2 family efflux MFS transporter permease subunit [Candidatus Peregrinibacteria bacterium]|nr:MAG: DHA2 family efflux MFS transporter permease subunit [Candidatus Peregrinibacteria bacterium]
MSSALRDHRWIALIVLCLGSLMIVLDTTIVNVALPSIRDDLGFSESTLAWVVNAYMLTFGGFLLLGGRLGDLFGHRKLFLMGLGLFTLASLACGLASTQELLIVARAFQGFGGAIVAAVALSLVMNLFTEPTERAKAMGVYGFVNSGGGTLGVLLGGILTNSFSWNWIFLVNVPLGILVFVLGLKLLPLHKESGAPRHLDAAGAVTITSAMLLAVYAIVNGNQVGWGSAQTWLELGGALVLLLIFIAIELKVKKPLMPLGLFKLRNMTIANAMAMLWAASMFSWFFLSALYLQLVLGYSPLFVGLAFLPCNIIMAILSLGVSAKLVIRFGIRPTLMVGLALITAGLGFFVLAPMEGTFVMNVMPSMILFGLGGGIAFNPLLLAAMNDVKQEDSGLASGMINTSFMMGGALGLAILASLASSRSASLLASGAEEMVALLGGYHAAFFAGTLFSGLALLLATLLKIKKPTKEPSAAVHF